MSKQSFDTYQKLTRERNRNQNNRNNQFPDQNSTHQEWIENSCEAVS